LANRDQPHYGDSDPDNHGRHPKIRDARRSPSPNACGSQAFAKKIWQTPFPVWFRTPPNITNAVVWLKDFRLACRAGGVDGDLFIIQYLPVGYMGHGYLHRSYTRLLLSIRPETMMVEAHEAQANPPAWRTRHSKKYLETDSI